MEDIPAKEQGCRIVVKLFSKRRNVMKKNKLLIVAFLLFGLLIPYMTGCSMDVSDYSICSYNIVWNESVKKVRTDYLPTRVYYQINNVPSDQYLACKYRGGGLGADEYPVLMRNNNAESSLTLDTESAKLFLGRFDVHFTEEDWLAYGQRIMKQELAQVESAVAEQLVNRITADSPEYINVGEYDHWSDRANYLYNDDGDVLRLQFSIEEYDSLLWIAFIVKYEDSYFIEIKEGLYDMQYLRCPDDFASVIEKISDEYSLK